MVNFGTLPLGFHIPMKYESRKIETWLSEVIFINNYLRNCNGNKVNGIFRYFNIKYTDYQIVWLIPRPGEGSLFRHLSLHFPT